MNNKKVPSSKFQVPNPGKLGQSNSEPGTWNLEPGTQISVDHFQESLRAQFERQERLHEETLKNFAFNFAHQVRNPLGIIQAEAEALHQKPWLTRHDHEARQAIVRNAKLLLERLHDIEDFCQPIILDLKAHLLGPLLEESGLVIAERCDKTHIELTAPHITEPVQARFDYQRLKIALLQILINAIESMPEGGRLSLITEISQNRGSVDIKITDSGPGIRPDLMRLVGQPFFTTKENHLGIGLALAQRIAHAHQGEIIIESLLGRGTRVILNLPTAK
ncbi:MAG: HAMP domain-containing histidine kinase [Elusimicrobia bacterium]|nr:HAMP domain-containing histidine kinase [Elusimicrobiota bacterium]